MVTGTNLQALIDYVQNPTNNSSAEIGLVISNKPGVKGLERARASNIPTKVTLFLIASNSYIGNYNMIWMTDISICFITFST